MTWQGMGDAAIHQWIASVLLHAGADVESLGAIRKTNLKNP